MNVPGSALAQWMMEERVKDALREAEQERLIRAAQGSARNGMGLLEAALLAASVVAAIAAIWQIV